MAFDPFNLEAMHADVQARIAKGEPGLAQINLGQILSLVCSNGSCGFWGTMPADASYKDIRGAIMDDLADDGVDNAIASRVGVFTSNDFRERARYYETRMVFPPKKDLEFAKKLREFAATW